MEPNKTNLTIYTIGHSTRSIEEFIAMLHSQNVTRLVDIRTIPKSLHNPQFQQTALEISLPAAGIEYIYLKTLGGLRSSVKSTQNDAWRNKSFRNYANYMQTEEFRGGVEELLRLGADKTCAIMCAEAVPWRCHRSLVGDALTIRGVEVRDIFSEKRVKQHTLTSFAAVNGLEITYPKSAEVEGKT